MKSRSSVYLLLFSPSVSSVLSSEVAQGKKKKENFFLFFLVFCFYYFFFFSFGGRFCWTGMIDWFIFVCFLVQE